jgi:hypothetical protein
MKNDNIIALNTPAQDVLSELFKCWSSTAINPSH